MKPDRFTTSGIVLCMRPANERWRYNVTSSLICWAHTQNDPCTKRNSNVDWPWFLCFDLYSLWPKDAIWWHKFGSTLAQVMACCLMAPSQYLTPNVDLSSVKLCGIHLMAIFTGNADRGLKITYLKWQPHLPGGNELNYQVGWRN